MNGNAEMLNYVYQNSQMGIESLKQILKIVENERFGKSLEKQLEEYQSINTKAGKMLNENGCDEKGINGMEKITSYLMINMKTLTDKSSSHIADMLIKGSNMGIVDATKKLHKYEDKAEKDIIALMKELQKMEGHNLEELKKYL